MTALQNDTKTAIAETNEIHTPQWLIDVSNRDLPRFEAEALQDWREWQKQSRRED